MLKFKKLYNGFFLITILLSGCNGSSGDSGGGNGQDKDYTHPIANSFVKKIASNYKSKIDFSDYIYDENIDNLEINTNVKEGYCNFEFINGTEFQVTSNKDGLCIFSYNVKNIHGLSTTQSGSILSVSSVGVIQYPVLANYSATTSADLNIDVFSDLIAKDPSLDLSGKVINEIYTTGVGSSIIDPSGTHIVFTGSDFGVSSILYTIQDSVSSDIVGYGRIDIAVSSDYNQQPKAEEAIFPTIIEPNTKYLVDLDSFSPSIIDDADGDELQIIDLKAFEGKFTIDPVDAGNLNNKRFYVEFANSSANVQDVSYTITDHNGGYATNVIRFKFNSPSAILYWRDIYYKNYKRFLAPLTKDLMSLIFPMISESNVEDDIKPGESFNVSTSDFSTAKSYCISRGARLPREHEFANLFTLNGNLYNSDQWPHKKDYWLDNGNSININTGVISSPSTYDELYITCAKGGLEYSSIINDNSISNGKDMNRIDFMIKDVYGIPLSGEKVEFETSSPNVVFASKSSITNIDGFAVAEFSSTVDGTVGTDATYIDDILSADSQFVPPPTNSIAILPESDSCIFGKCVPMEFGLADTIRNAALVTVQVVDDRTGLPVQNAEVSIEPKDPSEYGKILFHNVSGGSVSTWLPTTSCFTQDNGQCLLSIALSDPSIFKANFKTSVKGIGTNTVREDYINFSGIISGKQGTFDFQSGNNRVFGDPDNHTDCKGLGPKDSSASTSTISSPFANTFSPQLEVSKLSDIGVKDSNFFCMSTHEMISPFHGRRVCTGLYTSHYNSKRECTDKVWYSQTPEANSTMAQTGSGSLFDGDNRYLVIKAVKTGKEFQKPGGFNYKLSTKYLPIGSEVTISVEYDLYWVGNKYDSGEPTGKPGAKSYMKVGLFKGIDTGNAVVQEQTLIDLSSYTPKKWEHKKQSFKYIVTNEDLYFRLWLSVYIPPSEAYVFGATMFMDNLRISYIF